MTLFYMNINVTLFQGRSQGVERGELPPPLLPTPPKRPYSC